MNRIYILGEVLSISKVHFDYYNKLKAYFKFSILDMYGNVFECVVLEKVVKIEFEKIYEELNKRKERQRVVVVIGTLENGEYILLEVY